MPVDVGNIRREHVDAFVDLQERGWRPATVAQRFRSPQWFFHRLASKGDIKASPIVQMHAPIVPVEPPQILRPADRDRLLAVVKGTDFESRRDNAILRLLFDTRSPGSANPPHIPISGRLALLFV